MEETFKITEKKPVATMLIGHQYTGKSTFVNGMMKDSSGNFKKHFPKLYNLDLYCQILLEANGRKYTPESWSEVVGEANKMIEGDFRNWLKENRDIIFDRTNTTKKSRMKILNRLKNYYDIDAIIFPSLTDDEIHERIATRPNQFVPFDVVIDFRNRMEDIDDEERRFYRNINRFTKEGLQSIQNELC